MQHITEEKHAMSTQLAATRIEMQSVPKDLVQRYEHMV
jgi:hypothetical protein